jgi:CBS domain-containing protein
MNVTDTIGAVISHKGSEVWSISPDSMVIEAVRVMAEKNIGALLVMHEMRLLGIVSERDYTRKVVLRGKSSKQTPVREIMTTPVITVTPSNTVEECMRLMTERRVRHLPVIIDDKVAGVVSIGNLVNWTIAAQDIAIDHLEGYIAGRYPG